MNRSRCSITKARRELAALVRSVELGADVELTRMGRPIAVLVSARRYAALTRGPDLWEAIRAFRRTADLEDLRIDEVYRGVRPRTPGRTLR